jgi:hypothetical protein
VRLPEALLDRMRQAADPPGAGFAFASEMAGALRERVQGLRISTLHGTPDAAERLLAALAGA